MAEFEDNKVDIWSNNTVDSSNPVIGIDLGTSNSCVGIWDVESSCVKIIKNLKYERLTPTTVKFRSFKDNEVDVGLPSDDPMVLSGFKRYIGLTGEQITGSYINGSLPQGITTNHHDELLIKCRAPLEIDSNIPCYATECRSPEDLSMLVLIYLKKSAEKYLIQKKLLRDESNLHLIVSSSPELPTTLTRVVIGVPHTFTTSQRNATRRAAERAGFTEVHLIIESTAAALGYGLLCAGSKSILVVDIGGGTTDVTISSIHDQTMYSDHSRGGININVMATAGHSQCGGNDIDHLFAWYLCSQLVHTHFDSQPSVSADQITPEIESEARLGLRILTEKCRLAKEVLSLEELTSFSLPSYSYEALSHIHVLLTSSLSTYLLSSSSSTWRYANYTQSRTSSQVTSNHSSLTDIYSRYSDIIADIDFCAHETEAEDIGMDIEETWRTVPDTINDTSERRDVAQNFESKANPVQLHSLRPTITKTPNSFEFQVSRSLLSNLMTPILVQIQGVISTALDIYCLNKAREIQPETHEVDIDEVILVGGSSLIPCIQEAVRDVLIEKRIASFCSSTQKEFCSSICPYECVVNGLAVKGGLLSGVKSSILQDILMIDVTPSSIGLLISTKGSSTFEALISRGTSLPCKVRQTYEVDEQCLQSGFLTLQLYEEVYTANDNPHTISDHENLCEDDQSDKMNPITHQVSSRVGYSLYPLGSYDLPIRDCVYRQESLNHDGPEDEEITGDEGNPEDSPWFVDIELSMNSEGILSYAACPPIKDFSSLSSASLSSSTSSSQLSIYYLCGYITFLFLLYLFAKLQFNPLDSPSPSTTSSSSMDL